MEKEARKKTMDRESKTRVNRTLRIKKRNQNSIKKKKEDIKHYVKKKITEKENKKESWK